MTDDQQHPMQDNQLITLDAARAGIVIKVQELGDYLNAVIASDADYQQAVQRLDELLTELHAVAESWKAGLATALDQRDDALHELHSLEEAIERMDRADPRIDHLWAEIREMEWDEFIFEMDNSDFAPDSEEQHEIAIENATATMLMQAGLPWRQPYVEAARKVAFAFFSHGWGHHTQVVENDPHLAQMFRHLIEKAIGQHP